MKPVAIHVYDSCLRRATKTMGKMPLNAKLNDDKEILLDEKFKN